MVLDQFHPKIEGGSYPLSTTLTPLTKHRSDFTVFSNLDHDVRGGHSANHTLLSAVKSTERAGYPYGNITLDQRAAELFGHHTRFSSLVFWNDGMNFTRTGVRVPSIPKPSDAFKLMFTENSPEQKKADAESLGFALENFDATRKWRDTYENGKPVDPSGRMPDDQNSPVSTPPKPSSATTHTASPAISQPNCSPTPRAEYQLPPTAPRTTGYSPNSQRLARPAPPPRHLRNLL